MKTPDTLPKNTLKNMLRWFLSHLILIAIFAIVIYLLIFKSELFQPRSLEKTLSVQPSEQEALQSDAGEDIDHTLKEAITYKQSLTKHSLITQSDQTESQRGENGSVMVAEGLTARGEPIKTLAEKHADFSSKIKHMILEPVQPQIETPEQYKLLTDARVTFDNGDYLYAEALYKQLAIMLPELPDILAELSKLYKLQGELKNYLEINEQWVERLVNHQRFDEAWAVSEATAKINMDSANKQVEIIETRFKKFSDSYIMR